MLSDALLGLLTLLACTALAVMPLVVVLPASPPIYDDDSPRVVRASKQRDKRVNIFQKAHRGLDLSPEERALLKLIQGFVIVGLVAAAGTLATVVSNGATFHDAVLAVAVSFAVAVILAAGKYFSANGQAPLGVVLEGVASTIEHQFESPTPLHSAVPSSSSNDGGIPPDAA